MRWKTPEDYYDAFYERQGKNAPSRLFFRYALALVAFILFMTVVLTAYWMWQDYAEYGVKEITWNSFVTRAAFRWNEFREGRLGINECCASPTPQGNTLEIR